MKTKLLQMVVFVAVLVGSFGQYVPVSAQSDPQADARAICKNLGYGDGTTGQAGCLRGYAGAKSGEKDSSKACPANIGQPCLDGFDAFTDKIEPDSEAAINYGKARASCSLEKTDDKKRSCAQGYNGYLNEKSKKDACNGAKDKNACETGYDKAVDKKEKPNSTRASSEAVAACKNQPSDNEKKACQAGFDAKTAGISKKVACDDVYNGKAQAACEEGYSNGSNNTDDSPDCDAKLLSPLSWIICPIIDMGTAFTDFVFKTFVRGMLEQIPVSTDDDDGTYLAWKQFRLIGNIVLVGALLAIVYSQAKGGK